MLKLPGIKIIPAAFIAAASLTPNTWGADSVSKIKDIRKDKHGPHLYVVFCARDSARKLPGHAFIVLGKDDPAKQICSVEAFGFQPRDTKDLGILGPVPGTIVDPYLKDFDEPMPGICRLVLKVDRTQYDAVEVVRKKWASKSYRVVTDDCVSFTDEAAKVLGLGRPSRSGAILPQWFIRQLAEQN